eukprot:1544163-Ditylum_brightwellii.AAC.2
MAMLTDTMHVNTPKIQSAKSGFAMEQILTDSNGKIMHEPNTAAIGALPNIISTSNEGANPPPLLDNDGAKRQQKNSVKV